MLGSKSNYFNRSKERLFECRENVFKLLSLKGYSLDEILIYLKAFDFFCLNPTEFDGATIVKDLCDLPGLDLGAMLHDYQYLVYNVASNPVLKWKCDWLYAKSQERKGKGLYSAYSRFIGLTIIGIGFVPYARISRGKITERQKELFYKEYQVLIKK